MKVSVSLPLEDVEFLDEYARSQGFESRSAVVQRAVSLLRVGDLTDAYEGAWTTWTSAPDADAWDSTAADGLEG